jgi:diguanylate cyclase (GGDEF)-like protein
MNPVIQNLIKKIRSSLSLEIALIVTIPIVLMASFMSYHQYTHERNSLRQNAEMALLHAAENLKDSAEARLRSQDYDGLQKDVRQISLIPDITNVIISSHLGKIVNSNEENMIGLSVLDLYPKALSGPDVAAVQKALGGGYSSYYDPVDAQSCIVMPIRISGDDIGALFMSLDLKDTNKAIQRSALKNLMLALFVSLLCGVVIYALFHVLITKRVQTISSAANELASGNLSARADAEGPDEIGELACTVNAWAEGTAIWRHNLEKIVAGRMQDLTVLYQVVETTSQSLELDKVLPNVLDRVIESLHVGKGVVVLVDGDGKTLKLLAHRGLSEESLCRVVEEGQGCIGDVILMNNLLRVTDESEEGAERFIPGLEQDGVRSALAVPVQVRGEVLGVFAVYSTKPDRFSDEDEALLMTIGNQVAVSVENARLYEKTLDLARLDGLTGVANRRYLMERLTQEISRAGRYNNALSLIMMDLDKFKTFNDTYGHVKGDELLKHFARMVKAAIRISDVCGRYGGEEFCVILPNTSIKGAALLAERIRASMEEAKIVIAEDQPPAGRTVSIGIAEYMPGNTLEQLLSAADSALYQAKEGGRNRVVCKSEPAAV